MRIIRKVSLTAASLLLVGAVGSSFAQGAGAAAGGGGGIGSSAGGAG
jgi:hypothetical protein